MKVYGLWHGGANFSQPEASDAMVFDSIREARVWFWKQQHPEVYVCYPDPKDEGGPTMLLYGMNPVTDRDPYPFAELSFSKRGTVRRESL